MPIYAITLFEKIELHEHGLATLGEMRMIGFFESMQECELSLMLDFAKARESVLNYAVVEKFWPGIYPSCRSREFFQWNDERQGYLPIEEPACMEKIVNFGIG